MVDKENVDYLMEHVYGEEIPTMDRAKRAFAGLSLVTLMAGVLLVTMGATGLGSAVKFIPRPVIIGFTNGIALLIARKS